MNGVGRWGGWGGRGMRIRMCEFFGVLYISLTFWLIEAAFDLQQPSRGTHVMDSSVVVLFFTLVMKREVIPNVE